MQQWWVDIHLQTYLLYQLYLPDPFLWEICSIRFIVHGYFPGKNPFRFIFNRNCRLKTSLKDARTDFSTITFGPVDVETASRLTTTGSFAGWCWKNCRKDGTIMMNAVWVIYMVKVVFCVRFNCIQPIRYNLFNQQGHVLLLVVKRISALNLQINQYFAK